jgi:hypothetical protein
MCKKCNVNYYDTLNSNIKYGNIDDDDDDDDDDDYDDYLNSTLECYILYSSLVYTIY